MSYEIVCADVLEWAAGYEGEKFHALLTDSPYSLHFMGKAWDKDIAFQPETWEALTEHLHPGAFGMSFASARGWHRLAVAIEDVGLIIHPSIFMLGWIQGQGFPKASRVGKNGSHPEFEGHRYGLQAMKPALEPIIVFQKPYAGRPVDSIVSTGAGTLWIDGGRVGYESGGNLASNPSLRDSIAGGNGGHIIAHEEDRRYTIPYQGGRWPPNVCLTHAEGCVRVGTRRVRADGGKNPIETDVSIGTFEEKEHRPFFNYADPDGKETVEAWECEPQCPVRLLGEQSGERPTSKPGTTANVAKFDGDVYNESSTPQITWGFGDTGTAARFFYQAKASRTERNEGCEDFYWKRDGKELVRVDRDEWETLDDRQRARGNIHPTVKPIALAAWLARLLAPPPEYAPRRLLVPFCGSGSEMCAALLSQNWEYVLGIDCESSYVEIAEARLRFWSGWAERGYDDPKAILKEAKKEEKKKTKAQMELDL